MKVIADTHVHFYPCYDPDIGLTALAGNLSDHVSDGIMAGFLAERHDCSFLAGLRDGSIEPGGGIRIEKAPDGIAVVAYPGDGRPLYLVPGRQIVTSERLEILALATDCRFKDGDPAEATIRAVKDAGGVPVLSWAPGKWFFKRGTEVRRLIESHAAGELLIGDTSLRPGVWAEPSLMKTAARKGIAVVAGSDPMPFAGEEMQMGRYATVVNGEFSEKAPVQSFRNMLLATAPEKTRIGRRCGIFEVAVRLKGNADSKKLGN